jgi:hypothetical protein
MAFVGRTCRLALCVAGAGLLALIIPALATDLISTSPTIWQGFYVGGAWSDTDWRYDDGSIRSALIWSAPGSISMRVGS